MQYIDYSVSLQAYVFLQVAVDAISYIINNHLSYIASTIYFKISWNFLKGAIQIVFKEITPQPSQTFKLIFDTK